MEVGEQLLYFAQLKGMSRKDAMDKLKHWVEKFEIRSWWNKKVEELSKGMQQKIQFIATVLHEPDLLILDEPFTGFDPINAALITDEIKRLKSNGCTIIFSTHRMESVEQLCDDIALINKSEKILEGAVKDIRSMHRSETYILEYEGALWKDSQFAEIAYEQLEENRHQHVFKLTSASAVNQLLQTVLQQPLRIVRFEEKLLTMQEVFVTHVQASAS
jgi:ABC-2 type transport system ATP-binding protein